MNDRLNVVEVRTRKGTVSWRCRHPRCVSKGNTVKAAHQHKYVPVPPMEESRRMEIYMRGRGRLTVRQARQVRRQRRRVEGVKA